MVYESHVEFVIQKFPFTGVITEAEKLYWHVLGENVEWRRAKIGCITMKPKA